MVPIQFRNFSYPLVWISQEYFVNKQPKNTTEAELVERDKMLHDKIFASAENFNADVQPVVVPRLWNGWFPFDAKVAPNSDDNSIKECRNGRIDHKYQSEKRAMNVSEENVTRKASRSINKQLSTSLSTTQGIQFIFCLSES
jgi:hypothetical protein